MQKSASVWSSRSNPTTDQVLVIPRDVYRALHPLDQLMAQALEKIGKVRFVEKDD